MVAAIEAQKERVQSDPNWFVQTHHRRRLTGRQSSVGLTQMTVLPSISTLPTLSVGDAEEEEEFNGLQETSTEPTASDKAPLLIQMDNQSAIDSCVEEAETKVEAKQTEPSAVQVVSPVTRIVPDPQSDPNDSGVYDDLTSASRMQTMSEERIDEEEMPEEVQEQRIEPLKKWRPDENLDSGMISDADLQMISSAT